MSIKALRLLSLLPNRPVEFWDRVQTYAAYCWDARHRRQSAYHPLNLQQAVGLLSNALSQDWGAPIEEAPAREIESHILKQRGLLSSDSPFGSFHDGDLILGRFCYSAVRILQPNIVVETGVGYGVTSAFVSQALWVNTKGALKSIDLPPLGNDAEKYVGYLIPEELRSRWKLYRGTTQRLLEPLLKDIGQVGMFIHDSLHTYRNMRQEFEIAWPFVEPGGVLISDDIESNPAFLELSQRADVAASVVVRQTAKNALLGVAVKRK